jgi:hypothetical protein
MVNYNSCKEKIDFQKSKKINEQIITLRLNHLIMTKIFAEFNSKGNMLYHLGRYEEYNQEMSFLSEIKDLLGDNLKIQM